MAAIRTIEQIRKSVWALEHNRRTRLTHQEIDCLHKDNIDTLEVNMDRRDIGVSTYIHYERGRKSLHTLLEGYEKKQKLKAPTAKA